MMRAALFAWIGLIALTSVVEAVGVTVATFNIENYTAADRLTEAGYRRDYPKSEEEKQALRTVIHGLNADILVLQEMGPQGYLDELRRDLKSEGLEYTQAILLTGPDADRHIAVLSKFALIAAIPHADIPYNYLGVADKVKRGVLETRWRIGGLEFSLWAVHLKSRFTDRVDDPESAQRRAGEATAIRDLILKTTPDPAKAAFLVLGDFNDVKTSKPLRIFLQKGKTELMSLLPVLDSRSEAWTYFYRKEDRYERIDHVLVSPGLRSFIRDGQGKIYDEAAVRTASDHRPVSVVIELPEKK